MTSMKTSVHFVGSKADQEDDFAVEIENIAFESRIVCDASGRIIGWNRACERLDDWKWDDVFGRLLDRSYGRNNTVIGSEVVYILDDDSSMRLALDTLFRSAGLSTSSHASSHDFLQRRPSNILGCLVLDVRMPDISGLEFQLQMAEHDIRLPIVFLSGHADVPMSVRGMKAGAVDFLTKPFHDQRLLEAVSEALRIDRDRRAQEARSSMLHSRFTSLSKRELEVMRGITAGKMNKQVAGELGLSEITIKLYRRSAMQKMGARSLAELVLMSAQGSPWLKDRNFGTDISQKLASPEMTPQKAKRSI